jgi:hypothetical protein
MFALGVLVLGIVGGTAALVLRGGFDLSADDRLAVLVCTGLPGLILLGVISVAIEHRTAEPYKTMREVASGAFCLGLLAVVASSLYRTVNERGGQVYVLCGPQTRYDRLLLDYGLAMLLVAAVTFLLPNKLSITVTGLGVMVGGLMQIWVARLAMSAEAQLRAVFGDGMGRLSEEFPVIPLLMGGLLVLGGIGAVCWPWLKIRGEIVNKLLQNPFSS